jgi:hypothetical protein
MLLYYLLPINYLIYFITCPCIYYLLWYTLLMDNINLIEVFIIIYVLTAPLIFFIYELTMKEFLRVHNDLFFVPSIKNKLK